MKTRFLSSIAAAAVAALLSLPARAQEGVCSNAILLRQGTCPAGTSCSVKGSRLSKAEGDQYLGNIAQLCDFTEGPIVTPGSDGDSSTITSPSGMEQISDKMTLLRGCADGEILAWEESTDTWDCASPSAGSGDITRVGPDCSSGDCFTGAGTGNSLLFEGSTADDFEVNLTAADPDADRTITMPNETGTMVLGACGTDNGLAAFNGTGQAVDCSTKAKADDGSVAFSITGSADERQFEITFNSSQTTSPVLWKRSTGETMFEMTNGGNVGFGSTAAWDFYVQNSSGVDLVLGREDTGITDGKLLGQLLFYGTDTAATYQGGIRGEAAGTWDTTDFPTRLEFFTTPSGSDVMTKRMVIEENGRVGIGTDSIDEELHVEGTASTFVRVESTSAGAEGGVEIVADGQEFNAMIDGSQSERFEINDVTNSLVPFVIEANSANLALVIDVTGNIGLGTTSPSETLDVQGNIATTGTVDGVDLSAQVRSMYWPAGSLSSDGTQCADPTETTINSGPKTFTITCTDNAASIFYGSVSMPDGWNAGTVTYELQAIHTGVASGVLDFDFSAQCRGDGDAVNSTWGTAQNASITFTTANDIEHATTASATADGSCAAGDTLFWRAAMDDTATTAAVASVRVIGVKMEYATNGLD